MISSSLQMDPAFLDFNFSAILDPTLRSGPSQQSLFRLVYAARRGRLHARMEFVDTMDRTLHPAAFEAYQRTHDPFAGTYAEWFFAKLSEFFEILLYERLEVLDTTPEGGFRQREIEQPWSEGRPDFFSVGPGPTEMEIMEYLVPEDHERVSWGRLVADVCQAEPASRLQTLQRWLAEQRSLRSQAARESRCWGRNRARDEAIRSCLAGKMKRELICAELDRRAIVVNLPALAAGGFQTWAAAWEDLDGRQAIQRLYSKLAARP